jgi:hypothetical protein
MDEWVYDDGAVYVIGKDELRAFHLLDGSLKWSKTTPASSRLNLTNRGLVVGCDLYGCGSAVGIIETGGGQSVWPSPVTLGGLSGDVLWKDDHVIIALPTAIERLDLASGRLDRMATVAFRGGEAPREIRETARGYLVSSNQNVMVLDSSGTVGPHAYYRPPSLSALEKVGRIALSAGLTALSYAHAKSSATRMARQNAYLSALSGGSGVGYGFACYRISYPNLRARSVAGLNTDQHAYIYTEEPDRKGREGFSLVQFDGIEGREIGRAWVQERRPKMQIDPVLGLVYVQRGLTSVEAIRIEPEQ